jgi:hypothetical protein
MLGCTPRAGRFLHDRIQQAAAGEVDAGTMLPSAYVSEKDGNSDI